MSEKERQSAADMKEAREKLLECFPGSFINEVDEFIAHPRTNQYFILRDVCLSEQLDFFVETVSKSKKALVYRNCYKIHIVPLLCVAT